MPVTTKAQRSAESGENGNSVKRQREFLRKIGKSLPKAAIICTGSVTYLRSQSYLHSGGRFARVCWRPIRWLLIPMVRDCRFFRFIGTTCGANIILSLVTIKLRAGRLGPVTTKSQSLALDADLTFTGLFSLWPLLEPLSTLARAASRVETLAASFTD